MQRAIVIDLDDTLCDTGFVTREEMYSMDLESLLPHANVIRKLKEVVQLGNYKVFVLTARNETHRPATVKWLQTYLPNIKGAHDPIMQNPESVEPIHSYKKRVINELIDVGYDIEYFIDDCAKNRKSVASTGTFVFHPSVFLRLGEGNGKKQ